MMTTPNDEYWASQTAQTIAAISATGEEIGWRGYMLTRLVDAKIPRPILVSGLIWWGWHAPLILSGQYASGPYPALSALLFGASGRSRFRGVWGNPIKDQYARGLVDLASSFVFLSP